MQSTQQAVGEATGKVTLVQEDRLRLEMEDGRSLLLILGTGPGPSLDQVESWAATGRRVRVRYRGDPNAGPVVEAIHPE